MEKEATVLHVSDVQYSWDDSYMYTGMPSIYPFNKEEGHFRTQNVKQLKMQIYLIILYES